MVRPAVLTVTLACACVDDERRGEVDARLDPIVDLGLDVGTQVDPLVVRCRGETVLVKVAEGEHVLGGVACAGYAHIVVLLECRAVGV